MSEQTPEQPAQPDETQQTDPNSEPQTVPAPPNQVDTDHDDDDKTDQEQGVGVAPTQPGDAGEGNAGTQFESTEQIEEKLGRTGEEGKAE